MYEMSCQSRFDARYWMLGAGALGRPRGMEWGGRREEGSGWRTHVYLWQIHFDIWQNQYNIVKFKNYIKIKKKKKSPSRFRTRQKEGNMVLEGAELMPQELESPKPSRAQNVKEKPKLFSLLKTLLCIQILKRILQ